MAEVKYESNLSQQAINPVSIEQEFTLKLTRKEFMDVGAALHHAGKVSSPMPHSMRARMISLEREVHETLEKANAEKRRVEQNNRLVDMLGSLDDDRRKDVEDYLERKLKAQRSRNRGIGNHTVVVNNAGETVEAVGFCDTF